MNVLNVLSFRKRGHTGAAETVFRAQRGPADTQELCHKAVLRRGCWTLTLVCNFKKEKLTKNKT